MSKYRGMVVAVAVFASLPALARAEGTSCGNPTYVAPDGRRIQSTIPAGATFFLYYLNTSGAANTRSYVFEVRNTTNIWSQGFTVSAFSDVGVCAVALPTTDVSGHEPQLHPSSGNRLAFLHPTGNAGAEFSVQNTSGVPLTYEFSISDTTQFSPAWSTSGTYDTYYSFFNTTGNSISVTVNLVTTAGASAGSTTLVVPAGRTAATNTVSLATVRGQAGTAYLTVRGPVGSILTEADIANFTSTPGYIQPVHFEAVRDQR